MADKEKHHIVSYKVYFFVLLGLLTLTGLSVAVTHVDLAGMPVLTALVLASIKSILVLAYFMHLKFDQRLYAFMVVGVIMILAITIIITFLDYSFR